MKQHLTPRSARPEFPDLNITKPLYVYISSALNADLGKFVNCMNVHVSGAESLFFSKQFNLFF